MTETLANRYSSDRAQQELSNEYHHDRVWMDFKHLSDFISCVKIAAALKGLTHFHSEFPRRVSSATFILWKIT